VTLILLKATTNNVENSVLASFIVTSRVNFLTSLNLHKMGDKKMLFHFAASFPVNFPNIKTISTTETEIKSIIHSLKSKNLSGYDEISKILKACSADLLPISPHM
jgi:hypothetical protein